MIVKLLTEHHLEFLILKGDCRGSSESTLVILLEISCHGTNCSCVEVACVSRCSYPRILSTNFLDFELGVF